MHLKNDTIQCKLPQLQTNITEPRFVSLTLMIDEDNLFEVRQSIEYIPKIRIKEYVLTESQISIALNKYINANLTYYCVIGVDNTA